MRPFLLGKSRSICPICRFLVYRYTMQRVMFRARHFTAYGVQSAIGQRLACWASRAGHPLRFVYSQRELDESESKYETPIWIATDIDGAFFCMNVEECEEYAGVPLTMYEGGPNLCPVENHMDERGFIWIDRADPINDKLCVGPGPTPPTMTITGIVPTGAMPGDQLTITGTNFMNITEVVLVPMDYGTQCDCSPYTVTGTTSIGAKVVASTQVGMYKVKVCRSDGSVCVSSQAITVGPYVESFEPYEMQYGVYPLVLELNIGNYDFNPDNMYMPYIVLYPKSSTNEWQMPVSSDNVTFENSTGVTSTFYVTFNTTLNPGDWEMHVTLSDMSYEIYASRYINVSIPTNAPVITSITPTSAMSTGDVTITVSGDNLDVWGSIVPDSLYLVSVDEGEYTQIQGSQEGGMTFQFRDLPRAGKYELVFNLSNWWNYTGSAPHYFTITPVPVVTSITPACVTAYTGHVQHIYGQNFIGATAIVIDPAGERIVAGGFMVVDSTHVRGGYGEIEHDGPGDWWTDIAVVVNGVDYVAPVQFRVVPAGNSC